MASFCSNIEATVSKHSSCLTDLFNKNESVSGYDELSSDTPSLFSYYCFLAGVDSTQDSSQILYVYASTTTYYDYNCNVFNKILEHANNGLFTKHSILYNAFIQYHVQCKSCICICTFN